MQNDQAQYRTWIFELARLHGVPAELVLAQARQESGIRQYDAAGHLLRGKAGEVGIFQVKPSTAPGQPLDDPHANIGAGISELARLYRKFGAWEQALAAYNWGERYVSEWLRGLRAMPPMVAKYVANITGAPLLLPAGTAAAQRGQAGAIVERRAPSGASAMLGLGILAAGLVLLWVLD